MIAHIFPLDTARQASQAAFTDDSPLLGIRAESAAMASLAKAIRDGHVTEPGRYGVVLEFQRSAAPLSLTVFDVTAPPCKLVIV